jgi:hypothetical protein
MAPAPETFVARHVGHEAVYERFTQSRSGRAFASAVAMVMLPRSRRLRRRERARRRRFVFGVLVTVALIGGSLVHLSRLPPPAAETRVVGVSKAELIAMPSEPVEAGLDVATQPVYPYSIIPGGAASPEALRAAVKADPVVRDHYANFDLAKVRVVRLTEARVAHVSYRIGDRIFWTRRPLLLRADETLLTDGVHYARTRCGNQLAVAPGATSEDEPAPRVLDTPIPTPRDARVFPQVTLPVTAGSSSPGARAMPGINPAAAATPLGSFGTLPLQPAAGPPFSGSHVDLTTPYPEAPPFSGSRVDTTAPYPADPVFTAMGGLSDPANPYDPSDPPEPRDSRVPAFVVRETPGNQLGAPPPQVPEPGLTLLMLGGGGLWWRRASRRSL